MMEVSPSPHGPGSNGVTPASFPVIDPARLVDHLVSLVEIALGASREELEGPGSLLHKARYPDTIQRCTRFATDTQPCLYIQKDALPSSTLENGIDETGLCPSPLQAT
jgi:dynein heavy chain 1